ncbi:TonB-dependent receptor [Candidatus Poribacteria bacterium]|nr:TonB-dependent receptor [Candidatus Poribacteria bacterium]
MKKYLTIAVIIFFLPTYCLASQVFTNKDILFSPSNNLGDFLKEYAGINLLTDGELGQKRTINIRGNRAINVLIIVNDQILNSPFDNQADLSQIPLESIETIEIISDPDPVIYGINSSGGVIKITTLKQKNNIPYSTIKITWGDFSEKSYDFCYGNVYEKLSYFFSIIRTSGLGKDYNKEYTGQNFLADLSYKFDSTFHLDYSTNLYNNNIGNNIILYNTSSIHNRRKVNEKYEKIEINKDLDSIGRINFVFASHIIETKFDSLFTKEDFLKQDLKVSHEKLWSNNFKLILGYELNRYSFYSIRNSAVLQPEITDHSYFFQTQFSPIEKTKIKFGYRFMTPENYSKIAIPGIDVNYKIIDNLNVDTYYSQNYTLPNFIYLYGDNLTLKSSNTALKSEKSETFGININILNERQIKKPLFLQLKFYRTNFYNYLTLDKFDNYGNFIALNRLDAFSENSEIYFNAEFFRYFTSELGYAYINAREKNTKFFLPYEPNRKATYYLTFNKKFYEGDLDLNMKIGGENVGHSYESLDNANFLSPYSLLNAKIVVKIIDVNFYFSAANIQNTKYKTINSDSFMPEKRIDFGFKWDFWD